MALFSAVVGVLVVNTNPAPSGRFSLGTRGRCCSVCDGLDYGYCSQGPIGAYTRLPALWCVSVTVWDTVIVIARRVKNNRSPFEPDRNHLHHMLNDLRMTPKVALVVILFGATSVGVFGVLLTYLVSPLLSLTTFCGFLVAFGYGMLHPNIEKKLASKLGLIH